MLDQIEKLQGEFEGNEIKVIILMTLAVLYPLFAKLGFNLVGPLAIVVNSERQFRKLLDMLDGFKTHKIMSTAGQPKKVEKHLIAAKYGTVFFRFAEGRYTISNLKEIAADSQKIELNIENMALNFIIADKEIPHGYQEFFAGIIYIGESPGPRKSVDLSGEEFFRKIVSYAVSHIPEIKNAGEWKMSELMDDSLLPIFVAAEVLKLFIRTEKLKFEEVKELDQKIEHVLKEIEEEWQEADDPQAYAIAFRKAIFANSQMLPPIFDRCHFTEMNLLNDKELMFFDDRFYYMPEPVFCEICQSIKKADINYIKSQLVAAGVLISEGKGRSYYTKRTEIVTVYGYVIKIRLVKLARERIDTTGELTLQEMVEMRKEGEDVEGSEIGESSQFPQLYKNS